MLFFFPTVHLSVEHLFIYLFFFKFPTVKNTDFSQLYKLEEWVRLFSGSTDCGVTGGLHSTSNVLLNDQ